MKFDNEIKIIMDSKSQNEAFARIAAAGFISQLDPTLGELTDIKTAVSEAVTNAIIHGYDGKPGKIYMEFKMTGDTVYIEVKDEGSGIDDIEQARTPLYTSKPEAERSGMGFTVMETFMDGIEVTSEKGKYTKVVMWKKIARS